MSTTLADRISNGDTAVAPGTRFIQLKSTNLVERPWGGLRMLDYKGCAPLPDQKKISGQGIGEAFEVAACDSDDESKAYPSIVVLPDGSEIGLPQLLQCAGREILGDALYRRCNGDIPLLPKTLDIQELLSVQAHPPGNTELYVIIDADPGATIRLGFRHSVNAEALRADLVAARKTQEQLVDWLQPDTDLFELQQILAPAFADRSADIGRTAERIRKLVRRPADFAAVKLALEQLKMTYWLVLDMMNEIPLHAGQVIYNATPARIQATTGLPFSAEVHALGNPEQREIMMLEIRRPGVTFRAWDNVRFPLRDIDIDQTLQALNLAGTSPEEFEVKPQPVDGEPGTLRLVAGEHFIADQLSISKLRPLSVTGGYFHTLHCISGSARLTDPAGDTLSLSTGASTIVPAGLERYSIGAGTAAELIRVRIPQ